MDIQYLRAGGSGLSGGGLSPCNAVIGVGCDYVKLSDAISALPEGAIMAVREDISEVVDIVPKKDMIIYCLGTIDFGNTNSQLKISGGTFIYRTGQISVTHNSDIVNGIGVNWVSVLAGYRISIDRKTYLISQVISNTSLKIDRVYSGNTCIIDDYVIGDFITGIKIIGMKLKNSTNINGCAYIKNASDCEIDISVSANQKGMHVEDSTCNIYNLRKSTSNTTYGLYTKNILFEDISTGTCNNNDIAGVYFDNGTIASYLNIEDINNNYDGLITTSQTKINKIRIKRVVRNEHDGIKIDGVSNNVKLQNISYFNNIGVIVNGFYNNIDVGVCVETPFVGTNVKGFENNSYGSLISVSYIGGTKNPFESTNLSSYCSINIGFIEVDTSSVQTYPALGDSGFNNTYYIGSMYSSITSPITLRLINSTKCNINCAYTNSLEMINSQLCNINIDTMSNYSVAGSPIFDITNSNRNSITYRRMYVNIAYRINFTNSSYNNLSTTYGIHGGGGGAGVSVTMQNSSNHNTIYGGYYGNISMLTLSDWNLLAGCIYDTMTDTGGANNKHDSVFCNNMY